MQTLKFKSEVIEAIEEFYSKPIQEAEVNDTGLDKELREELAEVLAEVEEVYTLAEDAQRVNIIE